MVFLASTGLAPGLAPVGPTIVRLRTANTVLASSKRHSPISRRSTGASAVETQRWRNAATGSLARNRPAKPAHHPSRRSQESTRETPTYSWTRLSIAMNSAAPQLERLASLAHCDGGWGYSPDQPAHLEPTCLAILALSLEEERFREAIERGWRAVNANLAGDGTYRLARGRPDAIWPTALVLFTQSALGGLLRNAIVQPGRS